MKLPSLAYATKLHVCRIAFGIVALVCAGVAIKLDFNNRGDKWWYFGIGVATGLVAWLAHDELNEHLTIAAEDLVSDVDPLLASLAQQLSTRYDPSSRTGYYIRIPIKRLRERPCETHDVTVVLVDGDGDGSLYRSEYAVTQTSPNKFELSYLGM